jgi:hypothetical protein
MRGIEEMRETLMEMLKSYLLHSVHIFLYLPGQFLHLIV